MTFPRSVTFLGAAETKNFLGKSSEEKRRKSFWDGIMQSNVKSGVSEVSA